MLKILIEYLRRNMNLIEKIKEHEGFSSTVYKCPNGYDTVGYGQRVKYLKVTKEQAEQWLVDEVKDLQRRISATFSWWEESPEDVRNVVVSMVYQMGLSAFSKFKKTIYLLETEQYKEASEEMLDSKWARKDSPNRAKELSDILSKI